jgi:hypothetical protein
LRPGPGEDELLVSYHFAVNAADLVLLPVEGLETDAEATADPRIRLCVEHRAAVGTPPAG